MKFLIDECLSPELVETARNRSYHGSTHVNWLGLTSEIDWILLARAVADDYVFVTSNRTDLKGAIVKSGVRRVGHAAALPSSMTSIPSAVDPLDHVAEFPGAV